MSNDPLLTNISYIVISRIDQRDNSLMFVQSHEIHLKNPPASITLRTQTQILYLFWYPKLLLII